MLIERPPRIFRIFFRSSLFRIKGEGRSIYLTFDDGPIPEVTPWVLDTLDRYNIKATFFMVGDNARRHPELVEEVRRRGHAIGNHTMHHLQGSHVTTRRYLRDIEEANVLLDTKLFRPPHGWMRLRQARALKHRFTLVMYDLVTRDYSWRLTPEQVLENVKRYARPGAIVVFHDSLKSWDRISQMLPSALEWLLQQGYEFKVLEHKPRR
jgi:peptidoglycan/xylan/chitin deacetylase (PgdA/CDA1 family)